MLNKYWKDRFCMIIPEITINWCIYIFMIRAMIVFFCSCPWRRFISSFCYLCDKNISNILHVNSCRWVLKCDCSWIKIGWIAYVESSHFLSSSYTLKSHFSFILNLINVRSCFVRTKIWKWIEYISDNNFL